MTSPRDNLISWLRDAYAMECQAIELLEAQINRLEHYPEALPRLREHLQQTREQQASVEQCLDQLGADRSTLKETAMKLAANMQGMMHAMSSDEILKTALANHAFEHFEAAFYCSLKAAADALGEQEIARTCDSIMRQELAMADWVFDQLSPLTQKYLQREAAGVEAKM